MTAFDRDLPPCTVVVPVLDRRATIRPCIESLLALDYPADRAHIVVVDNGSTDGTREILDGFGDRIRVLHEPVRGPAAARNAGIRATSRDVIAFTDSDVVVEPGWLRHLVAPLADPRVGAVGGRILAFPEDGAVARFGEWIHDHRKAIEDVRPPYLITMSLATRRDVLDRTGLFDTRLLRCEDVDLAWRIAAHGYSLRYAHGAVLRHRNRSTLRALMREGYLHGFHAAHLVRVRHSLIARLRESPSFDPPRRPSPDASTATSARHDWPYGMAFRAAKRVGRAAGGLVFATTPSTDDVADGR